MMAERDPMPPARGGGLLLLPLHGEATGGLYLSSNWACPIGGEELLKEGDVGDIKSNGAAMGDSGRNDGDVGEIVTGLAAGGVTTAVGGWNMRSSWVMAILGACLNTRNKAPV